MNFKGGTEGGSTIGGEREVDGESGK